MEYAYMGEGNNPDDPVQLKPIIKSINSDRQIKYNRD